jgi:Uma2 family endonuclease
MRRKPEKYTPQYTYSEWLHWDERGELIKGFPIAKSTRIGPKHEKAVSAFKAELTSALVKAESKNCYVGEPIDYKIANDTILRPDVFIVCGKINKTYLDFPPVIVVEVISKATEERDRGVKLECYEKHGVKYYLVADAMKKNLDVYTIVDGKYEMLPPESIYKLQLNNNCELQVELDNIWQD